MQRFCKRAPALIFIQKRQLSIKRKLVGHQTFCRRSIAQKPVGCRTAYPVFEREVVCQRDGLAPLVSKRRPAAAM